MSDDAHRALVLTEGPDNCINAFPPEDWQYYMEKMVTLEDMTDEDHTDMIREVLAPATNCAVDNQWRVKIPPELAKYAKLDKDVRIVGHIDRFEIWNPQMYERYMVKEKPDKSNTIKRVFRPMLRKTRQPEE
jgi:MraZ protein